ncbi:hypothetical protein PR003_g15941 [Phytophthora rubi]|uniref:Uncharacterized protein n=1 Tax=Phytophthora rubi TaxID=129364 RepID=A0A6A3KNB6_9STRA|nr:hypothetical protein PR002_g15897 [Phytophthora rubi]KAE9013739.1 hypothetical protein PR001_g15325 [Phytophthora rubi]KAE9327783.1 hypothetical protein PR003_g15941 [Phytophthora rubi]
MKPAAKQLPKKRGTAKEGPKTPKLPPKRTDVLLPGPHEEVSSESSDTDTPNPGLIDDTGPAASRHSNAPRASVSSPPRPTKANAATTPPQGRSLSPDLSLQGDYEESEPDMDHEVGEVERSPQRITVAQRVIHQGSPMSPKTVVGGGTRPILGGVHVSTRRPARCGAGAPSHHQRRCRRGSPS